MVLGVHLGGVWSVFAGCLERICVVFGMHLGGVWSESGWCLESVWVPFEVYWVVFVVYL